MSAIEPLLVKVADNVTREEKLWHNATLCALTEEIVGLAVDLDNSDLNLSEAPNTVSDILMDMAVLSIVLMRRIETEAADVS